MYIVFHSSIAHSAFFSLYSEGTSASLDAVLRSAYDAAARSPDLLLIQGVLELLHGVDQLLHMVAGGSSAAPPDTLTRTSSPEATCAGQGLSTAGSSCTGDLSAPLWTRRLISTSCRLLSGRNEGGGHQVGCSKTVPRWTLPSG